MRRFQLQLQILNFSVEMVFYCLVMYFFYGEFVEIWDCIALR